MSETAQKHQISDFYVIAAFAFSIFFVRFDGFIVNLAMPTFVEIFGVTVSQASWIALAYILAQVSAIMLFGKVCDKFDLKKVFLSGMAVFTLAAFLCGVSNNFWLLLAFRCLQGLGGSVMLVSAYAAIPTYLPREKIGWGLGIMTTAGALGVMLGPVAGGWIINDWNWRWLFWINAPIGIATILYCHAVIPGKPAPENSRTGRLDWAGAAYSAVALLSLIFALNQGRELGWSSGPILGAGALAIIFFVTFYKRERKCQNPLLDMRLFENLSFAWVVTALIIGFFLYFGGNFLIPFYLTIEGLSPKQIGLAMTAFSIVYIPIGLYAGKLSDKFSPRKLTITAMFMATATALLFALLIQHGGVWPAILYLVMLALAYGLFFSPINHLIINYAGARNKGSASAIYNTAMAITMALGVAFMETIFSEFDAPGRGFTAAFCAAGAACLLAGILLCAASSPKNEA